MKAVRPPEDDEQDASAEGPPEGFRRWILPYFEDSSLWPVLLVVLAALAAFMTPILLRSLYLDLRALIALALIAFGTVQLVRWEWRVRGRPGGLSGAVAVVWALAVAATLYGIRTGLL